MFKKIIAHIVVLTWMCLFFAACASTDEADKTPIPITNAITSQASNSALTEYTVQNGDTLYAIAFKFGLDYHTLAKLNHLQEPFALHVGDVVCLKAACTHSHKKTRQAVVATKPAALKRPAPVMNTTPQKKGVTQKTGNANATFNGHFQWPATGPMMNVGSPHNKGINILGIENAPVLAAAAGKVVYAGDRLRGYGRLVIIKHNNIYLTAYAHNNKLLVKEGQFVKAGQEIAKMGNTDAKRVQLHFEIRKNGRPVDPLQYLPKPKI